MWVYKILENSRRDTISNQRVGDIVIGSEELRVSHHENPKWNYDSETIKYHPIDLFTLEIAYRQRPWSLEPLDVNRIWVLHQYRFTQRETLETSFQGPPFLQSRLFHISYRSPQSPFQPLYACARLTMVELFCVGKWWCGRLMVTTTGVVCGREMSDDVCALAIWRFSREWLMTLLSCTTRCPCTRSDRALSKREPPIDPSPKTETETAKMAN